MSRCLALSLILALSSGCSDDDPCAGVSGKCVAVSSGASTTTIQKAMIDVTDGGTVAFAAGHYNVTGEISLDTNHVTVKGAGKDATVLSFANQTDGAQGLLVTADGVTLTDFAVEDTPGDAIKILGANGISLQRLRVEWTRGANETNGSYGLYPVQCKNVLIEDSTVIGASDSGVYVGQSDNIVVRGNTVNQNVAGIEIENSSHAEVHDNTATGNTGGILVFNLPGLEVETASGTAVHDNEVFENNEPNFAPAGNIVGLVPTGTGIAILAAHGVEIFHNHIHDHKTVNIGVISYVPTMIAITDPTYDEFPTALHIHDNTLAGTSDMPTGELGALLITAIAELHPAPYIVPDLVWDGVLDPARIGTGTDYAEADKICIHDNGDADFLNMHYPTGDAVLPTPDLAPHACMHPAMPTVVLP